MMFIGMLGVCVGLGCGPKEASHEEGLQVEVAVRDEGGVGVFRAEVQVDSVSVGHTDEQGMAVLQLSAAGGRAQVEVACPEGFHVPLPRSVPLTRLSHGQRLTLLFACRPKQRTLLLVVRAPQVIGAQVLADGEPLGAVTDDGTFHAVVERAPGSQVRFALDTQASPRLLPQHPVRVIEVGDRDELVVFDQAFSAIKSALRPARRAASRSSMDLPAAEPTHRPYAIGSR